MEKQGKVAPPPGAPLCAYQAYRISEAIYRAKNEPFDKILVSKMSLFGIKNGKQKKEGENVDTITECNQKYADAFARLREKHGVTLQDVAQRSKIPLSTLKRTLQGETGTPMATYEMLVTQGLGATMHEFVDEIYGPVPQAEEPTQRYTAAVRLLLTEKDRRIQHLGKWLRWAVIYSVSVTGILIGFSLYDVLNPAVGWLRRHAEAAQSMKGSIL